MSRVDVLVVGLGPAGSSAAAAAARHGMRVLAVDRRREAGVPVQCAELVPALIGVHASVVARAIRQRVASMTTFVENDAPDVTAPFPGHMLDRAAFDAALVCDAIDAGAQCRLATAVRRISPHGTMLADGTRVEACIIVGADGPRSIAGRAIGHVSRELVETRQITVPLLVRSESTDIFLSAGIPGGYGWLFPKGDVANLGAGVDPSHRGKVRDIVADLHAKLVRERRVGARVLASTGGAIPVGGMVTPYGHIGGTNVLLAGDAAGLANPVTGAGIAAAVYSGKLAGEAAAAIVRGDAHAADDYEDELRSVLGASLERAVRRRQELAASGADKAALRRGWIAYPQYWV